MQVHTSAIVRERDCYQSVVNDNVQVYTPIAPRHPPQTVAEDLTTNKVSSASELKRSSSRTADRYHECCFQRIKFSSQTSL